MNANQLRIWRREAEANLQKAQQRLAAIAAAENGEPVEQRHSEFDAWTVTREPQFLRDFDYRPC